MKPSDDGLLYGHNVASCVNREQGVLLIGSITRCVLAPTVSTPTGVLDMPMRVFELNGAQFAARQGDGRDFRYAAEGKNS